MMNPEIRDQAYQFFIEEAPELLQAIESGLLALRHDRSNARVHEIMRAAHSLKGGAASVELDEIKILAHRLEDIFKALYNDTVAIDDLLESLLLQAYDCLKEPLLDQIQGGSFNGEAALARALPLFEQLEAYLGEHFELAEQYIPTSADLGIDIVSSLFEIDVAHGIEQIEGLLADPDPEPLTEVARTQLEVFQGFAEMLNLPGFGAIAQTTLNALERHPGDVTAILNLAVADLKAARRRVLEQGDRAEGGAPSPELLTWEGNAVMTSSISSPDVLIWEGNPSLDNMSSPLSECLDVFAQWQGGQSLPEKESSSEEVSDLPEPERQTLGSAANPLSLDDLFAADGGDRAFNEEADNSRERQSVLDDLFGESSELAEAPSLQTRDWPASAFNWAAEGSTSPDVVAPSVEDIFGSLNEGELQGEIFSGESSFDFQPVTEMPDPAVSGEGEAVPPPSLEEVFSESLEDSIPCETAIPCPEPEPADPSEAFINLVQSVASEFEQLLPADILSPLQQPILPNQLPNSTADSAGLGDLPSRPTRPTQSPAAPNLSVRVDFYRLERMNNLVGELAINRNSQSLHSEQLQVGIKELVNRFQRFQSITGDLRSLSDRMLIAPERPGIPDSTSAKDLPLLSANFDRLEMDSYGSLHSLLQVLLEEMMQLEESVDDIVLFARSSHQTLEQQRQMLANLRDELMWARMLPLGEVLNRFPRILRDLSATHHKPVRLQIDGTEVLVDKAAIEKLNDPLLHLLRNAFDHGIEPPAIRQQRRKPLEGTIQIRAHHQGNQTLIEIADDGGGLNLEKIAQKAVNNGLMTPEQVALASREQLQNLIFEPGFSTAGQVSDLSGRGVGLDVVRSQIRALNGSVSVYSIAGKKTIFTLRLPLTLTIAKLLICSVGSDGHQRDIAIPSNSIEDILMPQQGEVRQSGNLRFLTWGSQIIPVYAVKDLLSYGCSLSQALPDKPLHNAPSHEEWGLPMLIVRKGQQLYALEVNSLIAEQELAIKPFGSAIAPPTYCYGCTILGDGTLIPAIDIARLIEQNLDSIPSEVAVSRSSEGVAPLAAAIPTILVVDDSAALRRTLALTLQKAGYRVLQAKDGREALEQLQQDSGIQLTICDVEMPNMNGFEFLGQRRRDPEWLKIPVAMLTSRSSDKHRQLATQLGANAYFTKPYIEQQFLSAIQDLLAQYSATP